MFDAAGKRALHARLPLTASGVVIVGAVTPAAHVEPLRDMGVTVVVTEPATKVERA